MKQLPLTKGYTAIVDDDMFDILNRNKWSVALSHGVTPYAVRAVFKDNKRIIMHRFIWEYSNGKIPEKLYIDHIDRNSLNNQLSNLRLVTTAQNMANRSAHRSNKIGERGIFMVGRRYTVELWRNRKRIYQKSFKTLEEAIVARDNFLGQL